MVFILVNFLFNGWLLSVVYVLGYALMHVGDKVAPHVPDWYFFGAGFATVGLLMLLGISPVGMYLTRFFIGGRKAIGRERKRLDPLLEEVISSCNTQKGTNFKLERLHILMSDSKEPNAQSFGRDTMIFTDGLLKTCNDEEIKAIIAHELGHLHYKHGVKLVALLFGNFGARVVMWLYSIYAVIINVIRQRFGNGDGAFGVLLVAIPLLFFLPIVILNWFFIKLLNLTLLIAFRWQEYQVDKFAAELGYKVGLISFLEKLQNTTEHDNTFLGKVLATHPAPMKRIGKLEDN